VVCVGDDAAQQVAGLVLFEEREVQRLQFCKHGDAHAFEDAHTDVVNEIHVAKLREGTDGKHCRQQQNGEE